MLSGADKAPDTNASAAQVEAAEDDYGVQVDAAYYRWLTASGGYQAGADVEEHVLDLVRTLAADPLAASGLVPRIPELIPKLLRDLADDDVSTGNLARQVEQDLVLVAEVIREANSAYYRPLQAVKSLDAALMMIGQNGLRMDFGLPFGGFKQSGVGREGGLEGMMSYLELKTILLDGQPATL